MGDLHYLINSNLPREIGLKEVIGRLRNTSVIFVYAINSSNFQWAASIYDEAMSCFDRIVNEFLRIRDEKKEHGTYSGSQYEQYMNDSVGMIYKPASRTEQIAIRACGAGAAQLPNDATKISAVKLEIMLNKIKHRADHYSNYRIENDKHVFVICPEKAGGGADSIVEFNVMDFCDKLDALFAAV